MFKYIHKPFDDLTASNLQLEGKIYGPRAQDESEFYHSDFH